MYGIPDGRHYGSMYKSMKMKYLILLIIFAITSPHLQAQKYFTKEAKISFSSDAPLEQIEAHNNKGMSVLDLETGNVEFAILIKAFHFEKALMKEHFNENYMESEKFPKANFKGSIEDYQTIDPKRELKYTVLVKGELTIHGKTKEIMAEVKIQFISGIIHSHTNFEVALADFDIDIPSIVKDNISETVKISLNADYQSLDNKQ